MLEQLKEEVFQANMLLPKYHLVTFTWGNVSGVDREKGLVVIKPSGVEYAAMSAQDMVVVDLATGSVKEGHYKPSSDTATHLALYRGFPDVGGIAHTHSRWATAYAQARRGIPAYGTTHADYFYGEIPCTRLLSTTEIEGNYETETGKVILESFENKPPLSVPAALVACHGPFAWGRDALKAAETAAVLEEVAFMAWHTEALASVSVPVSGGQATGPVSQALLDRHYLRKHGENAYYGQGRDR